ncbi:hypothetical protein [Photobacterium swingsii]|uniref:hypothetical protein n=1 Tax=Photobacterium swingsii TaxID=680026 RepID=UPI004067AF29
MSTSEPQAYDEKNKADYDAYTDKISIAQEKISSNAALSPTIAELSRLTGIHRNTLSKRGVQERLDEIKEERKEQAEKKKAKKKDAVKVLEEQLVAAQEEVAFWFNKWNLTECDLRQLSIKHNRKVEALDWHKKELSAEREKCLALQQELNNLKDLLSK